MVAVAAHEDLKFELLDAKTAFWREELDRELCMEEPGVQYPSHPTAKCLVLEAIYGLKQAARAWYLKLKGELQRLGFTQSSIDKTLNTRGKLLVLVHVDDFLLMGKTQETAWVQAELSKVFDVKHLKAVKRFLSIDVVRDRVSTVAISQADKVDAVRKSMLTVGASPSTSAWLRDLLTLRECS
eukprot:365896-Chlamydomonas_euryale.AAC.7